ncbi:Acetyl-CoA decarbonylase/synthase complex subunit gamma [uncultured archaeon]|nr:Acetyl-CoA decarbonylase/synthase complex subunit gamma [uncultured archaeon]
MKQEEVKKTIRDVMPARDESSYSSLSASCAGNRIEVISGSIGYGDEEIKSKPESSTCHGTNPVIKSTSSDITFANRWDHFLARLGVKRNEHLIVPGLHALGKPAKDSPVFASANYTLSFDALRSALAGIDAYILVLDTRGINVWCAAGKGTFGTDEIVCRIEAVKLHDVVSHRTLIVPQLGATGVSAREVGARSGFKVEFGPVRAEDLPEYLKNHHAAEEMRRVHFTLPDRIVLIPVELNNFLIPLLVASIFMLLAGGYTAAAAAITAILSGLVLFPILLPWIPTTDFSTKGFIVGGLMALPFALNAFYGMIGEALWLRSGWALAYMLTMPPVTAFLALNFTGSTTFTSVIGVRREIFRYVPKMAWMSGIGIILIIVLSSMKIFGGM